MLATSGHIDMKRLLTAVAGVFAIEVLLIWGYSALVGEGMGITNRNVQVALLVGTVSVVTWFGYVWGWSRLPLVIVTCVILSYGVLVVAFVIPLPSVMVCDRAQPNIEVSSTRIQGRLERRQIGPCAVYTHVNRPVAGGGGGD